MTMLTYKNAILSISLTAWAQADPAHADSARYHSPVHYAPHHILGDWIPEECNQTGY